MSQPFRRVYAVSAFLLLVLSPSWGGELAAMRASTQLVVVTTSGWDAAEGRLQRYRRSSPGKHWKPVDETINVVVGKKGLAWGAGVASADVLRLPGAADPVKKEGDSKAPAGVFRLSSSFGYAEERLQGWKMPYINLSPTVECVDDSASQFYNRVVDRTHVAADWNSSEHMLRSDNLYRWGIIVDHNADPAKAGDGSCIFLHIWRGPGQGTVGCTAMPEEQLKAILRWLDPKRKPVLVQLPDAEYKRLRAKLNLP
jgi:D-alanyl-D-alanine dipeptidase